MAGPIIVPETDYPRHIHGHPTKQHHTGMIWDYICTLQLTLTLTHVFAGCWGCASLRYYMCEVLPFFTF